MTHLWTSLALGPFKSDSVSTVRHGKEVCGITFICHPTPQKLAQDVFEFAKLLVKDLDDAQHTEKMVALHAKKHIDRRITRENFNVSSTGHEHQQTMRA